MRANVKVLAGRRPADAPSKRCSSRHTRSICSHGKLLQLGSGAVHMTHRRQGHVAGHRVRVARALHQDSSCMQRGGGGRQGAVSEAAGSVGAERSRQRAGHSLRCSSVKAASRVSCGMLEKCCSASTKSTCRRGRAVPLGGAGARHMGRRQAQASRSARNQRLWRPRSTPGAGAAPTPGPAAAPRLPAQPRRRTGVPPAWRRAR